MIDMFSATPCQKSAFEVPNGYIANSGNQIPVEAVIVVNRSVTFLI